MKRLKENKTIWIKHGTKKTRNERTEKERETKTQQKR